MKVMLLTRRHLLLHAPAWGVLAVRAQEESAPPSRLGVLLDTSAEMGFLVPQARKELRILNRQLATLGRPPVLLRELEGASIDREASTSVGARRNALYALKALYGECDTVLWITALRGEQSSGGIFAVEQLLREPVEGRPPRRLLLSHVWQDQLQAGDGWLRTPPPPEKDPLDLTNRPEEWYRLVSEGRGAVVRSWQIPPPAFRGTFAFPYRVNSSAYLRKLGQEGREALFDQARTLELSRELGLSLTRGREEWLPRVTGRRWIDEGTLLPFPDEASRLERAEEVFASLSARESVEEDLARIDAKRLGVVFAFGYVSKDWKRHLATREKPPRNWREHYLFDFARVAAECAEHLREHETATGRVYATERIELDSSSIRPESPDSVSRRLARLAREEKCDAVYLFTNGFLGGGDFGTWSLDHRLLALAIRDAGTRLFVRVPFEFGFIPLELAALAMASGGGVFRGRADDPDWEMGLPRPAWPDPPGPRPLPPLPDSPILFIPTLPNP